MKRGASEIGGEAASAKKVKTEHDSTPTSVPTSASANGGGEWTKVEKRKKKKAGRAEARDQVCTISFVPLPSRKAVFPGSHLPSRTLTLFSIQMTHPRFMYSNTEIVKRSHAISVDVSGPGVENAMCCGQC